MKKMLVLTILVTIFSSQVFARDISDDVYDNWNSWSTTDLKYEFGYQALHVIDYLQTETDIRPNAHFREANTFLGPYPTSKDLAVYTIVTGGLHYVVSRIMSPRFRHPWQQITIIGKAGVIAHNYMLGVRIKL